MELFSPGHLLVIAVVGAFLFFGWKQMPDMARSLGRSLRIFKTEIKGMTEDDKTREAAAQATPPAVEAGPAPTPAPAQESASVPSSLDKPPAE